MVGKSVLFIFLAASSLHAQDAEALFVRRVWPLFQEKCLACHGNDEAKIKGGFDMRTLESTLKGGESELASLVPDKPEESPLYLASTRQHDDWEAMPPKEADKLYAEQLVWIKDWITAGAPWPEDEKRKAIAKANAEKWSAEDGLIVKVTGALSEDWANRRYKPEDLWAYQPLKKPVISVSKSENPIDAFVNADLPAGLNPAPLADAATLLRRLTLSLTGLPPSTASVADIGTEVDRLLASPHYGEHMARHWLDVARYADSSGFANDYDRGNTWRYRDYVIRSFNSDKPYDQFIKEQIAGDEINPKDPEMLVATGFLRMGPWELTGMEVAKIARQRFLDDVTNAVGVTFLGQALECARCHDHKFDPIPTHDYYAIQSVFATTQLVDRPAAFLKEENQAGFEEAEYLKKRQAEHLEVVNQINDIQVQAALQWLKDKNIDASAFKEALAEPAVASNKKRERASFSRARNALQARKVPQNQIPPRHVGFTPEEYGRERVASKGMERLAWEFERYKPVAFSVYSGATPNVSSITSPIRMPADPMAKGELEQTAILAGGDPFSPTTTVKPAPLSVVTAFNPQSEKAIADSPAGRRLGLAEWIASPHNPLTARVIANRVWLWHFGQPLAGNPNNFGGTGKKPTHPELLDFLAAYLIEKNWSLKELHRLILTSKAWQRSSIRPLPDLLKEKDPLGTSYAAFTPRRLTAEELRDAALLVTGELNHALGGIPVRPEINLEAALQPRQVMGTFAAAWVPNPKPEQRHRRSIYIQKIRGLSDPFMEVFNEPGPDFSCERRDASTVTPQVFSLFNSLNSAQRALALAHRVRSQSPTPDARDSIARLFKQAFNRTATDAEFTACLAHLEKMTAKHRATAPVKTEYPMQITRDAVEENTGEKFSFTETLHAYADFIPDLQAADVDAETRALAEVALVLLNSNEFVYVY